MRTLPKSPTGIEGLDEITFGGLPRGRSTLVTGGAGSGKTLLGVEFLVRGVRQFNEHGVLVAFEETAEDVTENVRSLGFDLERLIARKQIAVDYVRLERSEIQETGEYDLEGLFVRLGHAIDSVGAKRVVIDTLEVLFAGLSDYGILRAELRRLFRWLKERGVTAVITAERGHAGHGETLTRHGLEEFVSDCVILLDHRAVEQLSTRRLRIVKYRGSAHGTNEYPFLIDADGIRVLPMTSLGLQHEAPTARTSTGTPQLDEMLGGRGLYRGSTTLISGTAGSGKTTLAAAFVEAACRRGEQALYLAFEESAAQIQRNMRSVNIELERWVSSGRLHFHASRPTAYGFESHLTELHRLVKQFRPKVIVLDPITDLAAAGSASETKNMLTRAIDYLKSQGITAFFTSLTDDAADAERSEVGISSLIDTWIVLRNLESNGERNRGLHVLKARGIAHSNQIREFRLSKRGIELLPVFIGRGGVMTGTARRTQEAVERSKDQRRAQTRRRMQRNLEHKRRTLEAQIAALTAAFESEAEELAREITEAEEDERGVKSDTAVRARMRGSRHNNKSKANQPSSRGDRS
jgi:circadian clock protein KaiC